jgi:DNA-binding protein HU-beta
LIDQSRSHRQNKDTKLTKKDSDKVLDAIIKAISGSLAKGDKVSLVGFGSFDVRKRAARKGRNPQTGKEINIAARKVPVFKAGKALKDAVGKK